MGFADRFITGRTIDFAEIDECLHRIRDRWLVACNVLPSGDVGWYRRLSVGDRVGVVATSHAITALRAAGGTVPHVNEVVQTLISRRRTDGGWSFVSNINDVGVVDATAWVLLALYQWQDAAEFRALNLQSLFQGSLDWLEEISLVDGGWGLIAGASYRNYSSALAIQALCSCGRRSSPVVQRAVSRLVSMTDPGTGAWHDASRQLSVPTTAEAVLALSAAAHDHLRYSAEIGRASDWILDVGMKTQLWAAGPATACLEEVEVAIGERLTRIEYGHSPRPVALIALSRADRVNTPEAVAAMRILLDDVSSNRWEAIAAGNYQEPTSWMLYDIVTALSAFRSAFGGQTVAVWADNMRVVEHQRGQGQLVRNAKQHWTKVAIGIAAVVLAWMLVYANMVPGFGFALLLFIISTIALNVISNLASELLKNRRRKSSAKNHLLL